jgi:hypothetical protein
VPYSAGLFVADAGAFTVTAGQMTTYAYAVIGKSVNVLMTLVNCTLSAATPNLYVYLPAGVTIAKASSIPFAFINSGPGTGVIASIVGANYLRLSRDITASNAWSAGTSTFHVTATIAIT